MNQNQYVYFTWQCVMVLICGVVGLVAVFIKANLPRDVSVLFALVFTFCVITALFFLIWIKEVIRQEREDSLIDSIGEVE